MMKNKWVFMGIIIILISLILWFFFLNKKNININNDKVQKQDIEKLKNTDKLSDNYKWPITEKDRVSWFLTGSSDSNSSNKKSLTTGWTKISKEILREKQVYEKTKRFLPLLNNFVSAICRWKNNINDISCNVKYRFFVPKIHSLLYTMYKNQNLTYNETKNILLTSLQKNCKNLPNRDFELLYRNLQENNTICLKEYDKIFANAQKDLDDIFAHMDLKKDFTKPFAYYYGITEDLADTRQIKLQIKIIEWINKKAKENNLKIEDFKLKLLKEQGVDTIEALKQKIINYYEKLFNKYKLQDCSLSLSGYENYFVRLIHEKKAINCFKEKNYLSSNKSYYQDYQKLMDMLAVYSYLSKDFLWAKSRAKASFGPKWVGLVNYLDVNTLTNEKK